MADDKKNDTPKDQPTFDFTKLNFNFGTEGFKFEDQGNMLNAIQSRLGELVGKPSGYIESLPKSVQTRIKALQKLETQYGEIEKQFEEEVRLLELKYHDLYRPLLEKRTAFVSGKSEPTAEDLPKEEEETKEATATEGASEAATKEADKEVDTTRGIPDFWLTALKNHDLFEDAFVEEDEEALKYLEDVVYEPLTSEPGSFVLKFHFRENPFFTNELLEKTYHIENKSDSEEVVCESVDSTEIHWKEGRNLIQKAAGEQPSFFAFFTPPEVKEGQEPSRDTVAQMELDFEMAVALKEEVIPHAVNWFTGEAVSQRGDLDLFGDEDEGDEDDQGEDDDEDDEDGGEGEYDSDADGDWTPEKGKQEGNPECKQQ